MLVVRCMSERAYIEGEYNPVTIEICASASRCTYARESRQLWRDGNISEYRALNVTKKEAGSIDKENLSIVGKWEDHIR